MTPQPWFLIAGLLFILALLAGLILLVLAAVVFGAAGCVATALDRRIHTIQPHEAPDPVWVLAQLLADLAHHQQSGHAESRHPHLRGWQDPPLLIDVTAIRRTHPSPPHHGTHP